MYNLYVHGARDRPAANSMATLTIRIPDDVKKRMGAFDENWSDVLRDAIEERLRTLKRARLAQRMDRTREANFRRTGKFSTLSREVLKWRRLH